LGAHFVNRACRLLGQIISYKAQIDQSRDQYQPRSI
jgi:hypothetical protein